MLINVTIPVFNEESRLPASFPRLYRFLDEHCEFAFEVIIADNASTDKTVEIANEFSLKYDRLRVIHLDQKGRGQAIKKVWSTSAADIFSYMDVDLSTDLNAFPSLVEALISGEFDLAIGSRLLKPDFTTRHLKREAISRCYNLLVKIMFRPHFSDAQCGFKAITKRAAHALLPLVESPGWFMDTELLILAEKLEFRIFDLPVHWKDNSDSRVKIISTALEDIKGLLQLRRRLARGIVKLPPNSSTQTVLGIPPPADLRSEVHNRIGPNIRLEL